MMQSIPLWNSRFLLTDGDLKYRLLKSLHIQHLQIFGPIPV
jgi:hypothetical protein